MKADLVVNELNGTVNMNISYHEGEIGKNLTPQEAETVINMLAQFCSEACLAAFEGWLLKFECLEDTFDVQGKACRFKTVSPKEFMTFFGKLKLSRRVFQKDCGGKCSIPIDEA